ncbi:MAG: GNAT family N-acetyltransferase [Patescibacteria group bacterium]
MLYTPEYEARIRLPEQREFVHSAGGFIFNGKFLEKAQKGMKYVVNITDTEGRKAGYISFFAYPGEGRLKMAGLFVERNFRNKGLSHFFLQELSNIAEICGLRFLDTTEQKKPLTCAVLIKNDFSPVGILQRDFQVHVGKVLSEKMRTGVYFQYEGQRRHFEGSRIFNSQNCVTVNSLDELKDPIQVTLGRRYMRNGQ